MFWLVKKTWQNSTWYARRSFPSNNNTFFSIPFDMITITSHLWCTVFTTMWYPIIWFYSHTWLCISQWQNSDDQHVFWWSWAWLQQHTACDGLGRRLTLKALCFHTSYKYLEPTTLIYSTFWQINVLNCSHLINIQCLLEH